jgi:hypothetical protein
LHDGERFISSERFVSDEEIQTCDHAAFVGQWLENPAIGEPVEEQWRENLGSEEEYHLTAYSR